jgi:hypothetical protein
MVLGVVDTERGDMLTFHDPDSSVTTSLLWSANSTVIRSPGFADPHKGIGLSRCRTIPWLIILGSFTSAKELMLKAVAKTHAIIITPATLFALIITPPPTNQRGFVFFPDNSEK